MIHPEISNKKVQKALALLIPLYFFISVAAFAGQPDDRLIVYYFHRTIRCPSCTLLEELTRYAVRFGFGPQIKNGQIELKVVNIDEPENASFEERYHLQFQSVVLSRAVSGDEVAWKNLTRVWDYLHDDDRYFDYIQKEIRSFMEDKGGSNEPKKHSN